MIVVQRLSMRCGRSIISLSYHGLLRRWGEIPLGVYASCISPPNHSSWCFHSVTLLGQITYAAWGRASNQEGGFSEESARALNRIVWWEVGKAWRLFDMLLSICGTVSFWFSLHK